MPTVDRDSPIVTHWEGCWRDPEHHACAVAMVERLRAEADYIAHRWASDLAGMMEHLDGGERLAATTAIVERHRKAYREIRGEWVDPIPEPVEPDAGQASTPEPVCRYCGGPLEVVTDGHPPSYAARCGPCKTGGSWWPTRAQALASRAIGRLPAEGEGEA